MMCPLSDLSGLGVTQMGRQWRQWTVVFSLIFSKMIQIVDSLIRPINYRIFALVSLEIVRDER